MIILTPRLIKYGIAGASAVVADYGSFSFLYGVVKTPLVVATVVSLSLGFIVSFLLNKIWVFGAHKSRAKNRSELQLILYAALFSFNVLFTYVFLHLTSKYLGLNVYIGKFICIGFTTLWNYVAYKEVIFKITHSKVEDETPIY